MQHLDGEGALVLSRNRKQLQNGDLGRGQNQQLVIQALINKIRNIKSASDFMKILDTISENFDTNFTTEQILSFYSVAEDIVSNGLAKDDAELVNIEQLFLQGSGQMIYDERANMVLWDYVPNKYSRDDIVQAMKVNLGQKEKKVIKEFSFSVNEEYEKEVTGYGPYRGTSLYTLVPNFVGYSKEQASSIASNYGIRVTFEGSSGYVVSQSAPVSKRVDLLSGAVKLTLSKSAADDTTTKKKTDDDDTTTSKKKKDDEEGDDETKKTPSTDPETTPSTDPTPSTDSTTPTDSNSTSGSGTGDSSNNGGEPSE